MGESLGYSYLRHVKGCWLVQTNWKPSECWERRVPNDVQKREFQQMRGRFDPDGSVFKGTTDISQLLKQAEIDVVGIDQSGAIHAMDVAFHEAGLNYVGGADKRVLKKMLRTKLVLDAYHPNVEQHIYFASPKVNQGVLGPLEEKFELLHNQYPRVKWHLMVNEVFANDMLEATLDMAKEVSDTSELFVRSAKLLNLADSALTVSNRRAAMQDRPATGVKREASYAGTKGSPSLQDVVQSLMRTLLEDHPSLLSEYERQNLEDADYCREQLELNLGGFPLIQHSDLGRNISGHDRYYQKIYGAQYLVSNNWWRRHHHHNAVSLLRFVEALIAKNEGNSGLPSMEAHRSELLAYLDSVGS